MSPDSDTLEPQVLSILQENQQWVIIIDYVTTSSHWFTHVHSLCCCYCLSLCSPTFFHLTTTCSIPDIIVQSHGLSSSLTVNTRTTDQPQDHTRATRGIQSYNLRIQSYNIRILSYNLMVTDGLLYRRVNGWLSSGEHEGYTRV